MAGNGDEKKSWMVMAAEYSSLAFIIPSAIFVGWLIGYLLDQAFGTTFLKLVFLLLGIAAGFIELLRQLNKRSQSGE